MIFVKYQLETWTNIAKRVMTGLYQKTNGPFFWSEAEKTTIFVPHFAPVCVIKTKTN